MPGNTSSFEVGNLNGKIEALNDQMGKYGNILISKGQTITISQVVFARASSNGTGISGYLSGFLLASDVTSLTLNSTTASVESYSGTTLTTSNWVIAKVDNQIMVGATTSTTAKSLCSISGSFNITAN